jgi:hypothetical protein
LKKLRDSDPRVRAEALIEAFQKRDPLPKEALPHVISVFKDKKEHKFARAYSLYVMAKWGADSKQAIPCFLEALEDYEIIEPLNPRAARGSLAFWAAHVLCPLT